MIPSGAPILTAEAMREAEAQAFRREAQEDVMERAGAAIARETARFALGRPILVLAGPGNNGGDAYVAARRLKQMGHDVMVAAGAFPPTGAAQAMAQRWDGKTVSLYEARARPVLVDGLFGTGLSRALEKGVGPLLAHLVSDAEFALAIDLPSGLETDTGTHLGAAHMHATVALGALKPAHVLEAGLEYCGHLILADIGVPVRSDWRTVRRPRLKAPAIDAHKYSRGLVAVAEGAMPGAARLSARAALAGGAGYVMLAGPEPFAGGPDALVRRQIGGGEELTELLGDDRITAAVIGPGLGRDRRSEHLLNGALNCELPLVLDGDALSILGRSVSRWGQDRSAPTWLTPHSGEFDRMFGESSGSKIERTLAAAEEANACIVHKGADTVIATPEGQIRVLAGASSWLSTAGTGDVLAGLVAAQAPLGPLAAAEAAVWLHARAASLAGPAFHADRLIDHVPEALGECL